MAQDEAKPIGPDLSQGISLDQLADGKMLVGRVGGEDVLLVRRGQDIFAIGAHCTHYDGPLAEGRRYGAVSLASRLLRSAHWRGSRSASVEPDCVLAGRAARRKDLGKREAFPETECVAFPPMVSPRLCRGRNK